MQEDAGSSSSSDEEAEMSFTSDEDNHDEKALLGLVMEQEKRRGSTQGTEPEKKEKSGALDDGGQPAITANYNLLGPAAASGSQPLLFAVSSELPTPSHGPQSH